jgi:hypothetical protein
VNRNSFNLADQHNDVRKANLSGALFAEMSPLALLVFYTKWSPPYRWIEHVINTEYEQGLILQMQSYDVAANAEIEGGGEHVFFYTSMPGTEWIQSGRCAAVVQEWSPSYTQIGEKR